jgi:hypothetical protein
MTILEVLSQAQQRGLVLTPRANGVGARPNRLLTPDFARMLQEFKPALLPLLQTKSSTWIELYSERLNETVFFCADEEAREALIAAGADEWLIYTKAELAILVKKNRVAPFTRDELRKVHEIKRTFNARIAE